MRKLVARDLVRAERLQSEQNVEDCNIGNEYCTVYNMDTLVMGTNAYATAVI